MEHIPLSSNGLAATTAVIYYIAGGLLIAGTLVFFIIQVFLDRKPWAAKLDRRLLTPIFWGALVASGLVFLGAAIFNSVAVDSWKEQAREQLNGTYGLELTAREFKELEYPKSIPEDEGEPVIFGSLAMLVEDGDGYGREEISLVWDQGKIILIDRQGKPLEPLEPR